MRVPSNPNSAAFPSIVLRELGSNIMLFMIQALGDPRQDDIKGPNKQQIMTSAFRLSKHDHAPQSSNLRSKLPSLPLHLSRCCRLAPRHAKATIPSVTKCSSVRDMHITLHSLSSQRQRRGTGERERQGRDLHDSRTHRLIRFQTAFIQS